MYGDRLYCKKCKIIFIDTNPLYDSRQNGKPRYKYKKKVHFQYQCPSCFSLDIINIEQYITIEKDKIKNFRGNYKGSKLYHQFKQFSQR